MRALATGILLAAVMLAQPRPGVYAGGQVGPVGHGFGNVVFPGTGIPRPSVGVVPLEATHAVRLGATVSGRYNMPWPGRGGVYPVAVPVVVGGYPYGGYPYGYAQGAGPAEINVINAPAPSPTVIINQNYTPDRAQPVVREYSQGTLTETIREYQAPVPSNPDPPKRKIDDDKPTIYLIALKDGTVYSSYAYWVEGDTLHYITTRHSHNQATLDLVDAPVSEQLNRERGVEFKLKGAR